MKLADPASPCTFADASLPPVSQLLASGGDARIAIGPGGANRYGCRPAPDSRLLAFGSSTASTISEAGFIAASALRKKLQADHALAPATVYARELERIRSELGGLCGFGTGLEPDMIFAASGTDLHLIAASLALRDRTQPLDVIIAGVEETGRGVPMAVTGHHFSSSSALGQQVVEGTSCLDAPIQLHTVPVRNADGTPRNAAEIDCEIENLARQAITLYHRVLLVVVDVSKTGLVAPSPSCAIALRNAFPESIDLMVDACQFRISSATLQNYLGNGFMVALTASKFLTGPTFAGVLMVPDGVASGIRRQLPSEGISNYSSRADWPVDWYGADRLNSTANYGQLLRWEAGLAELRRFAAVPEARVTAILESFSNAVIARLQGDPRFEPLAVPALDRGHVASSGWDCKQTIFPFLLYAAEKCGRRPLSCEEVALVYQRIGQARDKAFANGNERPGCEIGQPVAVGMRDGTEVSVLRICMSARLVADAGLAGNEEAVINNAMRVLDEVAALISCQLGHASS
ncbi:hypothetical protein [Noviherbaspirillum saxi]|uniref:Uncharacterized protein n=1 Tax=Noviherbaspirillum saxi TaxID=2320863 RepID=A0A3A3GCJ9_9BURK|nr:hypothetical protein [Noviherbaspirillum saxi]RJF98609.1 hypothetical protein D3871_08885 [Noviherbaspirillum saxi]